VLLVVVALVVYDRLVASESVPMIDDSRTAKIFARSQERINESIPDDAPSWIVNRYMTLVSSCKEGS